jgi:hypothetical protein
MSVWQVSESRFEHGNFQTQRRFTHPIIMFNVVVGMTFVFVIVIINGKYRSYLCASLTLKTLRRQGVEV